MNNKTMSNVILKSGCVIAFRIEVESLSDMDLVIKDFVSDMRKELSDAANRVCAKYAGKVENYPINVNMFDLQGKRIKDIDNKIKKI